MKSLFTLFLSILTVSLYAQDWVFIDIDPNGNSNPHGFLEVDQEVYFIADNGFGAKLYKTDGTESGTQIVDSDHESDEWDAASTSLFYSEHYASIFLSADDGTNGKELWKCDAVGTGGCELVADINPSGDCDPFGFCEYNDKVYFSWGTYAPEGLWVTDGTEIGTHQVQDPNSPDFIPYVYETKTDVSGNLVFLGNRPDVGHEIFVTDGTANGTDLLNDVNPGTAGSYPYELVAAPDAGLAFFAADDGTNGMELWKTDGTPQGTQLVGDLLPGSDGSNPSSITPFTIEQNMVVPGVVFAAESETDGVELWFSDGTAQGTEVAADINPGTDGSDPSNITAFGDNIAFSAFEAGIGVEYFRTNYFSVFGQTGISIDFISENIVPGDNSWPRNFQEAGENLLFTADESPLNHQLFSSSVGAFWFQDPVIPEVGYVKSGTPPASVLAPPTATETDPLWLGGFDVMGNGTVVISGAYTTIGQELWIYTPAEVVTDVEEVGEEVDLNVYPNPSNGDFNVTFNLATNQSYKVELFETSGRLVAELAAGNQSGLVSINSGVSEELANGVYLLQLTTTNEVNTRRIFLNR